METKGITVDANDKVAEVVTGMEGQDRKGGRQWGYGPPDGRKNNRHGPWRKAEDTHADDMEKINLLPTHSHTKL